jgi:hypothetical protein
VEVDSVVRTGAGVKRLARRSVDVGRMKARDQEAHPVEAQPIALGHADGDDGGDQLGTRARRTPWRGDHDQQPAADVDFHDRVVESSGLPRPIDPDLPQYLVRAPATEHVPDEPDDGGVGGRHRTIVQPATWMNTRRFKRG